MAIMLLAGAYTSGARDFLVHINYHYLIHWLLIMELAYACCMPFHICSGTETVWEVPIHKYFISMFLNLTAMYSAYAAIGPLSASMVQMLRTLRIVLVFAVDVLWWQRKQKRHQWLGVLQCCSAIGLLAYGIGGGDTNLRRPGADRSLLLCVTSEFLMVGLYGFQETLSKKYSVPSLQLVGCEGLVGAPFCVCLLIITNLTGFEQSSPAINRALESKQLLAVLMGYFVASSLFEVTGVDVGRRASGVSRALCDACRPAVIWFGELYLGWTKFSLVQLVGFFILVSGMLTYNGTLPLTAPWLSPQILARWTGYLSRCPRFGLAIDKELHKPV